MWGVQRWKEKIYMHDQGSPKIVYYSLRTLWGPFSFFFIFCVLMFWVLGFCDDRDGPKANGFSKAYLEGLGDMDLGYGGLKCKYIYLDLDHLWKHATKFQILSFIIMAKIRNVILILHFEITVNLDILIAFNLVLIIFKL